MNYGELLSRHGLKMWGSFIVGGLAAIIPMFILGFIAVFALLMIVFAGVGDIDPFTNPAVLLEAIFNPATIVVAILFFLVIMFVSLLTSAFTSAGSIGVVSESLLHDRSSVGAYFRYGFRRLFPMLGLQIVMFLLAVLPGIPLLLSIFAFASESGGGIALGILLILLTLVAYIVYGLIIFHAPTALIAEQRGVFDSLAASFRAFRTNFGQVFLSAIIIIGISFAGGIVTLMLEWIIGGANPFDIDAEVSAFRGFLTLILLYPINIALQVLVTSTLVYRYLRVINPGPPTGDVAEVATVGPTGTLPGAGIDDGTPPEQPRNDP